LRRGFILQHCSQGRPSKRQPALVPRRW
jgi:hypothetical protein